MRRGKKAKKWKSFANNVRKAPTPIVTPWPRLPALVALSLHSWDFKNCLPILTLLHVSKSRWIGE
jgi:hypothetical protein